MLNKPEFSWSAWKILESFGWEKLPYEGGLLDQPDWLMDDLMTISWRKGVVKDMLPKDVAK